VPGTVRLSLSCALGVLALGAGGCASGFPVPQFPQLQEVGEIGEYGTQRLRASDACRKSSSTSVDAYVQCMEGQGWAFIARGTIYPAPECWSLRTAGDPGQLPTAQCFQRAAVPRVAPSAPAATP
jgi:hypothetical protein